MLGVVLGLLASSALGQIAKNIVAESCQAPHKAGAVATYTAPEGYLISGENYFVVTGCSAIGTIDGVAGNVTTDCVTGRTPGRKLGKDYSSITIRGGGHCGQARISSDPNDMGIYGSSNPGIKLVGTGKGPNVVASCCNAPHSACGTKTYTAPAGYLISGDNYLVVTGCSAFGHVVVNGKNLTAKTDCTTGLTPGVKLGADVASVTVYGGGHCGEARISIDPKDMGIYGSSNPGIKLVRRTIPNPVASCCQARNLQCGSATVTAPAGTLISGENYFVVTGCYASGSVSGTSIASSTDCVTGLTPSKQLGQNVASITIKGGGHCGEARLSLDPNDKGVYGSSNPGIYLVPSQVFLEEPEQVQAKPRPGTAALSEEGLNNIARLKKRVLEA